MSSRDWNEDYSFLLHSIEGEIAQNIEIPTTSYSNSTLETKKRYRTSNSDELYHSTNIATTINTNTSTNTSTNTNTNTIAYTTTNTYTNTSNLMQLKHEKEELYLETIHLKEMIQTIQENSKLSNEKLVKQVDYLFIENKQLKDNLFHKNEKYYQEMKTMKNKYNNIENEYLNLQIQYNQLQLKYDSLNQHTISNTSTISSSNAKGSTSTGIVFNEEKSNKSLETKIVVLENQLKEEKSKYNTIIIEKNQLNDKLVKMTSDYDTLHSNHINEMESIRNELQRKHLQQETKLQQLERSKLNNELKLQEYQHKIELLQQNSSLYETEIMSLRLLLQSYESEFQIGKPEISKMSKLRDELVTRLRSDLDSCRKQANEIVSKALSMKSLDESNTNITSTEVSSELEQKYQDLVVRYEGLQTFTKTDLLPGYSKVLHFIENPFYEAMTSRNKVLISPPSTIPIEELKYLRKEVKRLTGLINTSNQYISLTTATNVLETSFAFANPNISKFHTSTSPNTGGNPTVGITSNSSNTIDSNKLNVRLKEMFKERITSFREAVYLLFGYKLDLINSENETEGPKRLRLRSMFAESPEDSLLFQWKGEVLELLETPFASKLDSKLFTLLNTSNSIPAFLSNVTLELFENQTFMV